MIRLHLPLVTGLWLAASVFAGAQITSNTIVSPELHVHGNQLQTRDGKVVRLKGVNLASMEWSNDGEGRILKSAQVAIEEWKANALRVPVTQDRWFGFAQWQQDGGASYRALADEVVRYAASKGAYIILDLHWSDGGTWGKHLAQHNMPDNNSVAFWVDAASRYSNNPAVLFDLYNEPKDLSWQIWKNGGDVVEKVDGTNTTTYATPGMQKLVDMIRAAGIKNIIVAGGLDWSFDLSGIANGFALSDPKGNGVMYDTHIYSWKGGADRWDSKVAVIADRHPILVGEVGCEPDPKQEDPKTWAPKILSYIDKHHFNYTAWCFHTSASPRLLLDWNYTPTPYWGEKVKAALSLNE